RATSARRVLELGTSNGYSTLWLASATRVTGGTVTTVELSDYKVSLARQNFSRSGLASHITLLHDDAERVLERSPDAAFDLVFMDAERSKYPDCGPTSNAFFGPVACSLLIMLRRMRSRCGHSLLWSRPPRSSRRAKCL